MVAFTPGFISCDSQYHPTIADVAGKINLFSIIIIYFYSI
jgi:hypothetical protein